MLAFSCLLLLLDDHREQSLSSTAFKETMSHIVKDLAGLVASTQTRCVCFRHKYRRYIKFLIVALLNGFMTFIKEGE